MDIFNNSSRGHRNKSIIQLQESHKILKSNLMINKQSLDLHESSINTLKENIDNLKILLLEQRTREENIFKDLNSKITTMENYIEQNIK